MEWLWVLILFLVLFGPIVWAFTKGRRYRAPSVEDRDGGTGYAAVLRDRAETESFGGPG